MGEQADAAANLDGRSVAERLEFTRALVGKAQPVSQWNHVVTRDNIKHWAMGVGDDNPLWWDDDYASRSPAGGLTAPPSYLYSHANGTHLAARGEQSRLWDLPSLVIGERWAWRRSVRLDEVIRAERVLVEVTADAPAGFSGAIATELTRTDFRTPQGELVAENFCKIARFDDVEKIAERIRTDRPLATYDAAERDRIEKHYRQEASLRRGSLPRPYEDCQVGERLPAQLKGPLHLNNMIGYLLGQGNPWNATNRMFYALLDRAPSMRVVNRDAGVADAWPSAHWEPSLASQMGLPGGYDYAAQRCSWMAQVVTDWMGDHGVLKELDVRIVRPNMMNDLTIVEAEVVNKSDASHLVEARLTAKNQLDDVTAEGLAIVALPGRGAA